VSSARYHQFEVTVPADADYLKDVRRLVSTFAAQCGADDQKIADVVLAANEAASNVVLHAYGNDGGPLRIRGWQAEHGLTIEVSDNGTPVAKPPSGRIGGLGLDLIRKLCDDVDIEGPGEYGTRLEMTFTLRP
jgi:anti-sigma regulatory factor (Ser/Thr protein kinase)